MTRFSKTAWIATSGVTATVAAWLMVSYGRHGESFARLGDLAYLRTAYEERKAVVDSDEMLSYVDMTNTAALAAAYAVPRTNAVVRSIDIFAGGRVAGMGALGFYRDTPPNTNDFQKVMALEPYAAEYGWSVPGAWTNGVVYRIGAEPAVVSPFYGRANDSNLAGVITNFPAGPAWDFGGGWHAYPDTPWLLRDFGAPGVASNVWSRLHARIEQSPRGYSFGRRSVSVASSPTVTNLFGVVATNGTVSLAQMEAAMDTAYASLATTPTFGPVDWHAWTEPGAMQLSVGVQEGLGRSLVASNYASVASVAIGVEWADAWAFEVTVSPRYGAAGTNGQCLVASASVIVQGEIAASGAYPDPSTPHPVGADEWIDRVEAQWLHYFPEMGKPSFSFSTATSAVFRVALPLAQCQPDELGWPLWKIALPETPSGFEHYSGLQDPAWSFVEQNGNYPFTSWLQDSSGDLTDYALSFTLRPVALQVNYAFEAYPAYDGAGVLKVENREVVQ